MRRDMLKTVREKAPLVHSITNYVTVNDCANILLACGGSPIMADDIGEVADITSICNATVINIGTLNERTIEAMIAAGKKANELGHPVVLDPVGAGASKLRTETTFRLLREAEFTVIRGNISEIKTVCAGAGTTQGVDADAADAVTEANLQDTVAFSRQLAGKTGAVIVITGAIDIVTDAKETYIIRNGVPAMARITGTGCMLTGVIAAFCAAVPEQMTAAAAQAVAAMGICGELGFKKVQETAGGSASLRMHLIDAMSNLDDEQLGQYMEMSTYE